MAKPINPTPVLKNRSADALYKETERLTSISQEKKEELRECVSLYHKFYSRTEKKSA